MATIPGPIVLRVLEPLLYARLRELECRCRHSSGTKRAGRARSLAVLEEQLAAVHELLAAKEFAGPVAPAVLGWLCAWVAGDTDAPAQLTQAAPGLGLYEVCRGPDCQGLGEALRRLLRG